ncbi:MAG: GNAT family N-acetyltransferase [Solirubrobacteraceae bacterium]
MAIRARAGAAPAARERGSVALLTPRLALEPLRVRDAPEMAALLADPDLYRFTGGRPPTVDELRERYGRQVRGRSPDGREAWRNWIARRRDDGEAVGWLQATIRGAETPITAELAWTIALAHQRQGYAREAATAVIDELRTGGVSELVAHIDPDHAASIAVARALGLHATDALVGGETRWRGAV